MYRLATCTPMTGHTAHTSIVAYSNILPTLAQLFHHTALALPTAYCWSCAEVAGSLACSQHACWLVHKLAAGIVLSRLSRKRPNTWTLPVRRLSVASPSPLTWQQWVLILRPTRNRIWVGMNAPSAITGRCFEIKSSAAVCRTPLQQERRPPSWGHLGWSAGAGIEPLRVEIRPSLWRRA